jgi:hypothetical protein
MLHATRNTSYDKSGFFAVRKSWCSTRRVWLQRLVLDRRLRNERERLVRPSQDSMPHAVCFNDVVLEPDRQLLISTSDLPSFYYSVVVSDERADSNRFTDLVDATDFGDLRTVQELWDREESRGEIGRGDPQLAFALKTMAMGDLNATAFAQAGHVQLVRDAGAMPPDSTISYRQPWPRSRVAQGIMIDDNVVVADVPMKSGRCSAEAADAREQYRRTLKGYTTMGITDVPAKRQVEVDDAVVWGGEVRGRVGRVGVQRTRRATLAAVTLILARLGCCTTDLLRRVLGLWTAVLLFRRPAFAALDSVYLHISRFAEDPASRVRALPGTVRSELMLLAAFAPLLETNLRAQVSTDVTVTDASLTGAAAVRFSVPAPVALELWRRRLAPGRYGVLDQHTGFRRGDSWVSELCEGMPVREFVRFRFRAQPSSINVAEARAYRAAVRQLAVDADEHEKRHVFIKDSRVVLAAAAKGRARGRLLRECRLTYPHLLAADIDPAQQWGDSERNNADSGSRGGALPVPAPQRAWVAAWSAGDTRALDERLLHEPPRPHLVSEVDPFAWLYDVGHGVKHDAQEKGRLLHRFGKAPQFRSYSADVEIAAAYDNTPGRDRHTAEQPLLRGRHRVRRPLAAPLRVLHARRGLNPAVLAHKGLDVNVIKHARDELRAQLPLDPSLVTIAEALGLDEHLLPQLARFYRERHLLARRIDEELQQQAYHDDSTAGKLLPRTSRRQRAVAHRAVQTQGAIGDWTFPARRGADRLSWLRPYTGVGTPNGSLESFLGSAEAYDYVDGLGSVFARTAQTPHFGRVLL